MATNVAYGEVSIKGVNSSGNTEDVTVTGGSLHAFGELLAGEDQTNDVLKVESRHGYQVFNRATASANTILGGTGAAGDYLKRVTVTIAPVTSALDIYDGDPAGAGVLVLSIPATTAIGTTYDLGILATTNWTCKDDANAGAVICVGRFTA